MLRRIDDCYGVFMTAKACGRLLRSLSATVKSISRTVMEKIDEIYECKD